MRSLLDVPSAHRFHPARLVAREDAGGGLTRMTIAPEAEVAETHAAPGQYIEVRAGGQTGFFVLANDPGDAAWQLVMRAGGGASDVLLAPGGGEELEVTGALGLGFPVGEARGRPLLIALGGTGIAAARPLVRRRIGDGDAPRTSLYVGIRTRDELPMQADLRAWMSAGVGVLVCLSQGPAPVEDIPFASGYVQDVLRSRAPAPAVERIFAVGLPSMIGALRELARGWGLPPERVHTNY